MRCIGWILVFILMGLNEIEIAGANNLIWEKEFLGDVIVASDKNLEKIIVSDNNYLYILDNNGNIVWKTNNFSIKELTRWGGRDGGLPPDAIAASKDGAVFVINTFFGIHYYTGTEKKWDDSRFFNEKGSARKIAISSDGKYVAVLDYSYSERNRTLYFFDENGVLLWNKKVVPYEVNYLGLALTQNSEIVIIYEVDARKYSNFPSDQGTWLNYYILLNKNGYKVEEKRIEQKRDEFFNTFRNPKQYEDSFSKSVLDSWKKADINEQPEAVFVSNNEKRQLFIKADRIYFSSDVIILSSPANNAVINKSSPLFQWEGQNDEKYELKINDEIIKVTGTQYRPDNLKEGKYTWSVRSLLGSDSSGDWSKENSFSIVNDTKNVEIEAVTKPLDTKYLSSAIVFLLIGLGIFSIPFYKRWMVARKMVQTPTDWCPYCKKFTGGERICLHCGKDTLTGAKYEKRKTCKK